MRGEVGQSLPALVSVPAWWCWSKGGLGSPVLTSASELGVSFTPGQSSVSLLALASPSGFVYLMTSLGLHAGPGPSFPGSLPQAPL